MDVTVTLQALVVALLAAILTVLLHRWDRRRAREPQRCPRPGTDVAVEEQAIAAARSPGAACSRPASVVTVWPEDAVGAESSAVMLVRLREVPHPPTRTEHVVDDTLVAYSRICTHAGCPVALYRDRDQALFCPCHQATFDATAGATPVFGPASRPLPQLPLGVDDAGHLVATADFDVLPGPPGGGG